MSNEIPDEIPKTTPDSSWQTSKMLLQKLAEVRPEDIQNFRQQIKHDAFDIFDKLDQDKKDMLVTLHNLSDDELAILAKQTQKYILGAHDISAYLTTIHELTEDSRFEKFIN
jgi:hypothetical protein